MPTFRGSRPEDLLIKSDGRIVPPFMSAEPSLFPVRASTIYPAPPNGADILFHCEGDRGGTYYCKGDHSGRQIRATEWFFTHLAHHVGFATPECAIVERRDANTSFFGSRQIASPASAMELHNLLMTPQRGELGQPSSWPGAYLSQLYAFDLFAGNWDRSIQNFLLQNEGFTRRLCVFDFASCSLEGLAAIKFPVASDPTVRIGKFLRLRHGFFPKAAIEMIDRLAAIPAETITRFLSLMPDDWMSAEQKESICELWSKHQIASRLAALRSGLGDESLL
ncbi:hypothetical protein WR25_06382 [Diploscapter pachys]|jgi:hypothetical protein|uniref:HipA-like kinase domain-containing protein n=3 Tax=cellular organisms TaxID=131567 RepID=A0A2A2M2B1_9BILA|nr:hypothetical protein WR25_06382 [Diploscapter pachys]